MKTLLFSTSSLWNCGDDFIREGVLELLQLNEDTRVLWWNRGYGISNSYANNLKLNLSLTDYFLIAGTPKWVFKNEFIYRHCLKNGVPLSLIGVGTRDLISTAQVNLLKKVAASGLCEVALARDNDAREALGELGFKNVDLILDPCFFKKPIPDGNKKWNILGWREQFSFDADPKLPLYYPGYVIKNIIKNFVTKRESWSQKKDDYNDFMKNIFAKLPEPKMVIVHDNREIKKAEDLFGKENVFYSTDHNEIFKKYAQAKRYTGSRIHGAIPSVIHGAPALLMYTTSKAQVLSDAMSLLSKYDKSIEHFAKVMTYSETHAESIIPPTENLNNEALLNAIAQEKRRTHDILKSQKILGTYMR